MTGRETLETLVALVAILAVLTATVLLLAPFVADTMAEWGDLYLYGRLIHTLLIAVGLVAVVIHLAIVGLLLGDLGVTPESVACWILRYLAGAVGIDEVHDLLDEVQQLDRELARAFIASKRCRDDVTVAVPIVRPLRIFYLTDLCY